MMIAPIEEAANLVDSAECMCKYVQRSFETDPEVSGIMYGVAYMLETALNILLTLEDAEKEKKFAPAQLEENQGEEEPRQKITYQEMMTKQLDKSEDAEAAELESEAPEKEEEVKVDLRDVHNLRMRGKTAAEIAEGYGVKTTTVYGWFKRIKQKHTNWVEEWNRR